VACCLSFLPGQASSWLEQDTETVPVKRRYRPAPCSGKLQTLYESGNEGCYATLNLITFSWDAWPPIFPVQLFLTSRRPFLITFTTKSYLRSETHTAYKFYSLYPQITAFLEGNFYLCVESVMRVLDPFFLHIKSWCRQARNQLGTPGGAKSFLRGAQIFKLCPTHLSRGAKKL